MRLIVEVQDSGPGIADGERERVFQAFEQTASGRLSSGGTGLGMAISRQFARMLSGDITLVSRPGEGSTFRMEIEVREGSRSDIRKKAPARRVKALEPGQDIPRILVVEDLWESRSLLARLLRTTGFEVREAVNGQEALDICAQWRPRFIWMDIRMPVMDGLEAMRRIRSGEAGGSTIVAAITASGMMEDQDSIMAAGFDDYVRKPFREEEVLEIMGRHLGLRYLYESDDGQAPPHGTVCELTHGRLRGALEPELLNDLHNAVLTLDTERTRRVVEIIRSREPDMAAALAGLVDNLDFDRLLCLLDEAVANREG